MANRNAPASSVDAAARQGASSRRHRVHRRPHVPNGLRQALSGGATRPSGYRRRFLDRSVERSDETQSSARFVDGHALRHCGGGGRPTRRRIIPATLAEHASTLAPSCFNGRTVLRGISAIRTLGGGVTCGEPTGAIRMGRRNEHQQARPNYPVVHIAYEDAVAFARVGRQAKQSNRGRMGVCRARRDRRRGLS